MTQELCECGQPKNSIRHSFATASSMDAHEFRPDPASAAPRPQHLADLDKVCEELVEAELAAEAKSKNGQDGEAQGERCPKCKSNDKNYRLCIAGHFSAYRQRLGTHAPLDSLCRTCDHDWHAASVPATTLPSEDTQVVWFHGTSKENGEIISREGFKPGTWFARHMEDAVALGGPYVFFVKVHFADTKPYGWQVLCENALPASAIERQLHITDWYDRPSQGGQEKCYAPAGHSLAGHSWFACVLPKGHAPSTHPAAVGGHLRGGNCFEHGGYVGKQCPQSPTCGSGVQEEAGGPTLDKLLESARKHEMTPEEKEAQRQSWVRGEMGIDAAERAEGGHTSPFPPVESGAAGGREESPWREIAQKVAKGIYGRPLLSVCWGGKGSIAELVEQAIELAVEATFESCDCECPLEIISARMAALLEQKKEKQP
jgi:hypothetical protein